MKKPLFFPVILLIMTGMASCLSFERLTLDNSFEESRETVFTDSSGKMIHLEMREEKNRREIIYDRFSTANLTNWYSCNHGTILLSDQKKGMTADIDKAYNDCFGIYFYPVDIRNLRVLKIKASIKAHVDSDIFDLTFILQDKNGIKSSVYPTPCYPEHTTFKDYCFDLSEFLYKNPELDAAEISNLIILVNTRGGEPASGIISIAHIEFTEISG